jgi:hypothetical protein
VDFQLDEIDEEFVNVEMYGMIHCDLMTMMLEEQICWLGKLMDLVHCRYGFDSFGHDDYLQ